ncbi:uncharacterized protein [Amphiura filiformis]|uniref:uncharacterized protein n=1 Tax=Amphiura filiformis TaxID=82378 RepID=UPI003B228016
MPKTGRSDKEWRERLTGYAHGTFKFGKGQKPPKSSKWSKELDKIDKCPRHRSPSSRDPFGRILTCNCRYHDVQTQRAIPAASSLQGASPSSLHMPAESLHRPSVASSSQGAPPSSLHRPSVASSSQGASPSSLHMPAESLHRPSVASSSQGAPPSSLHRPSVASSSQGASAASGPASTMSQVPLQGMKQYVATGSRGVFRAEAELCRGASKRFVPYIPGTAASPSQRQSPAASPGPPILSPRPSPRPSILSPGPPRPSPRPSPRPILSPGPPILSPAGDPSRSERTASSPETITLTYQTPQSILQPSSPTLHPSSPAAEPQTPYSTAPTRQTSSSSYQTSLLQPSVSSAAASIAPSKVSAAASKAPSKVSSSTVPSKVSSATSKAPSKVSAAASTAPSEVSSAASTVLSVISTSSLPADTEPPQKTDPSAESSVPNQKSKSLFPRQKIDYGQRLAVGWEGNMEPGDRAWVGQSLYAAKGKLVSTLKNWWYPPSVKPHTSQPSPQQYFLRRLFLWMPRKMNLFDFRCPKCPAASLRSKGVYNRVRLVLDLRDFYYLAGEYMDCKSCGGTYISWDKRILDQLPEGIRARFPVILTHKYACDESLVALLRARTLGNSPTALQHNLQEVHSDTWLKKLAVYLSDCQQHQKGLQALKLAPAIYEEAAPMRDLPRARWFLAAYVRDVWTRLPQLQASITSVYGSVIKIDSTKKVTKKLTDTAAAWATTVGNEKGEVLQVILTTSEGTTSLQKMADGLMNRFDGAGVEPPHLLYTDRDCCSESGMSRFQVLFSRWPELQVRLDIWHYMRRMALSCSSESHPLYGIFMKRLSGCIFEWDRGDFQELMAAKRGEMLKAGIPAPLNKAVQKAITKDELARHCRRRTRGADKTTELIESLLLSLSGATDVLGVPLFRKEMKSIWEEQKQHISCIQDPPNVPLYTITGQIIKGGISLPVFRCARGTTSLECFHLHLARFIPGTSANSVHFQAYLLDGISRWNAMRAVSSLSAGPEEIRSFDMRLKEKVNKLSMAVHNKKILPRSHAPAKYTGEDIGVQYLWQQSEFVVASDSEQLEQKIDEGFEDYDESGETSEMEGGDDELEHIPTPGTPSGSDDSASDDNNDEEEEIDSSTDGARDARGIPGWDKVDALAQALVSLRGLCVTNKQAQKIKTLWKDLLDFDKKPITFKPVVKKPPQGRFKQTKKYQSGYHGVEAMRRCFLSGGSPALSPARSRLVEAICVHLCAKITQPRTEKSDTGRQTYTSRWKLILAAYNEVRLRLLNSEALLEGTNIMLYHINETTLVKWFKNEQRRQEVTTLLQGRDPPGQLAVAAESLPPAQIQPQTPQEPMHQHEFDEPEDRTGLVVTRHKAAETPQDLPSDIADVITDSDTQPITPTDGTSVSSSHSRTTEWRHRKKTAIQKQQQGKVPAGKVERKQYTCRACDNPMTSGDHTQFRGKRYCPNVFGAPSKQEWLAERREEARQKKAKAAAEKSAQSAPEKSTQSAAAQSAQSAAEKSAQSAAEKSTQSAAAQSAQSAAEKSAQSTTEGSTQRPDGGGPSLQ